MRGMTRTILDDDLEEWEVFATAGRHGVAEPTRIVFRSRTTWNRAPRAVDFGGHKGAAERAVVELPDEELRTLLAESKPID